MPLLSSQHFSNSKLAELSKEDYGSKVEGLVNIPSSWTPPFLVLPTKYYKEWEEDEAEIEEVLPVNEIENGMTDLVEKWEKMKPTVNSDFGDKESTGEFVVRSSAYLPEELKSRGQFRSEECPASIDQLLMSIKRIYRHARNRNSQGTLEGKMGIIIQPRIPSIGVGHLSNERRVSRAYTKWHLEWEKSHAGDKKEQETFSILNREPAKKDGALFAMDESEVRDNLIGVSSTFADPTHRNHFEWVWDGATLWLVQLDFQTVKENPGPGTRWEYEYPAENAYNFDILSNASEFDGSWNKTQIFQTLDDCGIEHPNLFIITGQSLKSHISSGNFPLEESLREELKTLMEAPVVVRTDVQRDESTGNEVFTPRSDAILDLEGLVDFLIETYQGFLDRDFHPTDFCFLIHHFIVSKSCALARASPNNPEVLIDSTWGIPDGLNYYPHDSFRVNIDTEKKELEEIRCKERYLDVDGSGAFVERTAGKPWDWKTSISDENVFSIAQQARRIADHENEITVVMFFVDLGVSDFGEETLPWYFWPADEMQSSPTQSLDRWSQSTYTVRNASDLDALRGSIDELSKTANAVIRFNPTPEYVRDTDFVEELAGLAKQLDVPIQLEGSILSHAYYILQRSDADVQTEQNRRIAPYRRRFTKLVRDKIPPMIEAGGEEAITKQVSSQDVEYMLKAKAVEEALEFSYSDNSDEEIEELADMYEIIRSYAEAQEISVSDIQEIAKEKREEKGGFEEGLVLLSTFDYSQSKRSEGVEKTTDKPKLPLSVKFHDQVREELQPKELETSESDSIIEAPLIPPSVLGINEIVEFQHNNLDVTIEIKYEQDRIIINVKERSTSEMVGEQSMLGEFTESEE